MQAPARPPPAPGRRRPRIGPPRGRVRVVCYPEIAGQRQNEREKRHHNPAAAVSRRELLPIDADHVCPRFEVLTRPASYTTNLGETMHDQSLSSVP